MLEREEFAGVVFATGLVLVFVGVWGLGGERLFDYAAAGTGAGLAALGTGWWQLLRRR